MAKSFDIRKGHEPKKKSGKTLKEKRALKREKKTHQISILHHPEHS